MTNVEYRPAYEIRVHDKGWGVYLTVDIKQNENVLVITKDTWIATFVTKELADQYIDLLFSTKR